MRRRALAAGRGFFGGSARNERTENDMKTIHRVLGILGLVVLIVAITGVLLARYYRMAYREEKAARQAVLAASADYFFSSAQEHLFKASLALNRENFELAREDVGEARRVLAGLERLPYAGEILGAVELRDYFSEIDTELVRLSTDAQKKIMDLVNLLVEKRAEFFQAVDTGSIPVRPA